MKVLLIAVAPVRRDLTSGNTFSNLFEGMEGVEFSNIYMKAGTPDNNFISQYFQVTPKMVLRNLICKNIPAGKRLTDFESTDEISNRQRVIYDQMRLTRFQILFWCRDLIWSFGNWKSEELKSYIDDIDPDIIFAPIYDKTYGNRMVEFVQKYSKKPMVGYIWDDVYSLKQFSLSPLYWIDRLIKRHYIRRAVSCCKYLYVISDKQKREYTKLLNTECRLLYKGNHFGGEPKAKKNISKPLHLVYMGNIAFGRWKALVEIVKALKIINKNEVKADLSIYTLSPKSKKMNRKLNVEGISQVMPVVPPEEVETIHRNADVLVHVEPMNLKDMLSYRLSFSTKIVDYFHSSRCILAFGGRGTATMEYLKDHDAALVINKKCEIVPTLKRIIENPEILNEYSVKAWKCGKKNHQLREIQKKLMTDFRDLCGYE